MIYTVRTVQKISELAWQPGAGHRAPLILPAPRPSLPLRLPLMLLLPSLSRVSEHVGLPLAASHRRLAINGAAAVQATLPHRLHASTCVLPESSRGARVLFACSLPHPAKA